MLIEHFLRNQVVVVFRVRAKTRTLSRSFLIYLYFSRYTVIFALVFYWYCYISIVSWYWYRYCYKFSTAGIQSQGPLATVAGLGFDLTDALDRAATMTPYFI